MNETTINKYRVTVTFVNLVDQNQKDNTGKTYNGGLVLQKDAMTDYYAFPNTPSTTYASLADLQAGYVDFASKPCYIKTTTTEHQVCVYYNNREFCLGTNYWVGDAQDEVDGSSTKAKLKADMENALGVTIADSDCDSDSTYTVCSVSDFSCGTASDGMISCYGGRGECDVDGDGEANCYKYN